MAAFPGYRFPGTFALSGTTAKSVITITAAAGVPVELTDLAISTSEAVPNNPGILVEVFRFDNTHTLGGTSTTSTTIIKRHPRYPASTVTLKHSYSLEPTLTGASIERADFFYGPARGQMIKLSEQLDNVLKCIGGGGFALRFTSTASITDGAFTLVWGED